LYASQDIVRMIKSRGMRLEDHVAQMGEDEKCIQNFFQNTWREEATQKS